MDYELWLAKYVYILYKYRKKESEKEEEKAKKVYQRVKTFDSVQVVRQNPQSGVCMRFGLSVSLCVCLWMVQLKLYFMVLIWDFFGSNIEFKAWSTTDLTVEK